MCQHKEEINPVVPLDIKGIGSGLQKTMGGDVFDKAYLIAGSPRLKNSGKGILCSCDLIGLVDENIAELSAIAKRLGCSNKYQVLVGLACYIESKISRLKVAA